MSCSPLRPGKCTRAWLISRALSTDCSHRCDSDRKLSGCPEGRPVTIDARGGLRARSTPSQNPKLCDDAVVLVRATPTAAHTASFSFPTSTIYKDPTSALNIADSQSVAVRISVRDVNELSIIPILPPPSPSPSNPPTTPPTTPPAAASTTATTPLSFSTISGATLLGPLCFGSNVSVNVVVRDHMGRAFTYLEGWGGDAGGAAGALVVKCFKPEVLRVQKVSNTRTK